MSTPAPHEVARLRESADWLLRLSHGALDGEALSDEDLAAWMKWCEDDANVRAFEEMQNVWEALGRLEPQAVSAPPQRNARMSWLRNRLLAPLLDIGAARRQLAWGVTTAAALGACALFAWMAIAPATRLPPDGRMNTHLAENHEARLPDGSTVTLGAQSSLALEYIPTARRLKLTHGQAWFNVAHDKSRPFTVDTGDLTVRAVGTAFDVRRNDGRVVVTVTEGIVDILTPDAEERAGETARIAAPLRVAAGYQLIWDRGHRDGRKPTLQLSHVDAAGMTAWREGRLEYTNEPLSVVIADVNRYSSRRLVIEGDDLGSFDFTGTILVDSIGDWLKALQMTFPVRIEDGQDGSLIVRRTT